MTLFIIPKGIREAQSAPKYLLICLFSPHLPLPPKTINTPPLKHSAHLASINLHALHGLSSPTAPVFSSFSLLPNIEIPSRCSHSLRPCFPRLLSLSENRSAMVAFTAAPRGWPLSPVCQTHIITEPSPHLPCAPAMIQYWQVQK